MRSNNANLFLAVLVVIGFIFVWDAFVVKRFTPPAAPRPAATTAPSGSAPAATGTMEASSKPLPLTKVGDLELTEGNDNVTIESQGARVKSWRLHEKNNIVELVYSGRDSKTFPLETFPDISFGLESSSPRSAVYAAKLPSGLILRKTISLAPNSLHQVTLEFSNPTPNQIQTSTEFGWGSGLNKRTIDANTGVVRPEADPLREMRAIALSNQLRQWKGGVIFGQTVDLLNEGPFEWAGVDNRHFLAALIPSQGAIAQVHATAAKKIAPAIGIPLEFKLDPKQSITFSYLLYVGPKRTADLLAAGHNLDKSITFGTFGFISKGLLSVLEYFRRLTGNYGWAIVMLTICIQIVVYPLTRRSLEHSVKMKTLQPQLKALQEQFKSDPKRMQIETMNLYKKNGMHFMGLEGCFPVMLQIPIFFAFYAALNGAYELRGAPWIFWIHDLAAPDPFYVLPILMGLGMFLQQKLTTVATDPAQARMAMMMPFIFVFMFFRMPAGLVLYWTVNSICTVLNQRLLVLRQSSGTPAPS